MGKKGNGQKRLTARSLVLVDARGKPRIMLDAGDESGFASINLFGHKGGSIQISTQPCGGLQIALLRERTMAELMVNTNGDAQLSLTDREGRLGTLVGSVFNPNKHSIVLFKNGQDCFSLPKKTSTRPVAKTNRKVGVPKLKPKPKL